MLISNCIFCGSTSNELTDEHIIPEFAGGSLKFRAVCKSCNSRMGSDFEGPLANNFLFALPRLSNQIQGKTKKLTHPFQKDSVTNKGLTVSLDENFQPRIKPMVSEVVDDGKTTSFSVTVDVSDKAKIPKIIEQKVRRQALKSWPHLTEQQVNSLVEDALSKLPENFEVQRNRPTIHYEMSIPLHAISLLFMKIAFEMGVYHYGISYLEDPIAIKLCQAVQKRDGEPKIRGAVPMWDDPFKNFIGKKDCHVVLLLQNMCYIRIFDLAGQIELATQDSIFHLGEENAIIYFFNYKTLQHNEMEFLKYINNSI